MPADRLNLSNANPPFLKQEVQLEKDCPTLASDRHAPIRTHNARMFLGTGSLETFSAVLRAFLGIVDEIALREPNTAAGR